MSTVLKPIIEDWEIHQNTRKTLNCHLNTVRHKPGHGIKHKENYFKHKCNKALKNKLKKYKLRRDGKEDPDVINVSHTFQSALKIKSPNNNNNEELDIYDIERPKNYLFKMVRRKKDTENVKSIKTLFKELPDKNVTTGIPLCVLPTEISEIKEESPRSQDKQHMNAFKLMMESRNKSIGGNSPGKEKPVDEAEVHLKIEEKNTKAKRLLVLQKMAEQKGLLKKKEKEELLEEAIKRKMDKRAERLTSMLVNNSNKKAKTKKEPTKLITKVTDTKLPNIDKQNPLNEKQSANKQHNGALHLINIFDDPINDTNMTNGLKEKCLPKEDLEFLKKLSPSIRKKENMLCYFKKLEKDQDAMPPVNADNTEMSPIIKVKFGARKKKKLKKKKLSLNIHNSPDLEDKNTAEDTVDEETIVTNTPTDSKHETRKRKREQVVPEINDKTIENNESQNHQLEENKSKNGRPKRNVKKPLQYNDDFILSSSDEEYHIFTPKKKKHSDNKSDTPKSSKEPKSKAEKTSQTRANTPKSIIDPKPKSSEGTTQTKANTKDIKKPLKNNDANKKANVKLAPIFALKPQLDPAALEAKQRFLQSGVPEKLKKIASQQKQIDSGIQCFPTVLHVQQIMVSENTTSSNPIIDSLRSDPEPDLSPVKYKDNAFRTILSPEKLFKHAEIVRPDNNIRKVLQNIKQSYPKFPVYRTYQSLKEKSKGEFGDCNNFPEFDNSIEAISNEIDNNKLQVVKLNWTDKYKPMVTNQIIGNFETTKELKKWLESWSANDAKRKTNDADSDSSDFYHSDTDSRDSVKSIDNLLVLTGPTGCGKTSCVYAVAADLAIKVIEVNSSSKRNGKIMLQDLQEATQSHKVNRGKGTSAENSQKSQDIVEVDLTIKTKKRGRPKKSKQVLVTKTKSEGGSQSTNSQESTRTGMSLILIDDADIVFDQDDGFCSAISQLAQYSKRPVILVTTSLACAHLQRFLQSAKIMTMKPLLPRMLGTWLDLMCLADSGSCWPGLGTVLLDLYKGDIRKTINCLQFYSTTHTHESAQTDENSPNIESLFDETSSMSWAGSENQEERNITCEDSLQLGDRFWKYFMERQSQLLHIKFPSDLWHVWWNIPNFLMDSSQKSKETKDSDEKRRQSTELQEIAIVMDNFSAADYLGRLRPDAKTNLCSQPWYSSECDSSSELENFSYYNKSCDVNDEISKTLVVRSIINTQKCLQYNEELYVRPTSMAVQRNRDRIVKRHDSISTHLNPGATLDRRALALDYWSSCRAICRFEKAKTDTNLKRNNRFCHYLRSLKIMCKNDVFDKLGESLNVKEGDG